LLPTPNGGFMALSGQLPMKGQIDMNDYTIVNLTDPANPQDAVNLRSLTLDNFQDYAGSNVQAGQFLVLTGDGNTLTNVSITGDVVTTQAGSNLNVQIVNNVIVDSDVNTTANILQSKLLMSLATATAAAPGGTTAAKQALSGLTSFNSADFTVIDGWVTLKSNSVATSDLAQLSSKTVLGNSTLSTDNASAVPFTTVVDSGLGIKKSQYSGVGFLKRNSSISNVSDSDYGVIDAIAGSSILTGASQLIVRDVNGDFGGRTIDISQIKVDTKLSIDSDVTATGGYLRYYGYDSGGGILISNGSLAADKKSDYWNDSHIFKTQNGVSLAPITASAIQVTAITTGLSSTTGTITGRWTLTGTSPNESRLQSTYSADLAEHYEGDKDYQVGTVLVFGGDKEVTTTNVKGDTRVAGVVSNTAAFAMYEACPGLKNLVALQGRVPCRVVGRIKKGDILVTSGIPGVAMAAVGDVKVGTVVGKALTDYNSDHIGTLEIAVGRT